MSGVDLRAAVVGESDASPRGLVGGIEHEAGAVESSARGPIEVTSAPDVWLAELFGCRRDEGSREALWEVRGKLAGGLGAVKVAGERDTAESAQDLFGDRLVHGVPVRIRRDLHRLRCARARVLLEITLESVPSVALACGYEDASAFRRVFVRYVGMTPAAYRERHALRAPRRRWRVAASEVPRP